MDGLLWGLFLSVVAVAVITGGTGFGGPGMFD